MTTESRHLYLEDGVVVDQLAIFEDPRGHGGQAEHKTKQRANKAHSAKWHKVGNIITIVTIKQSII